ncbi:hypothetical protein DWU99_15960 [Dyella psychrodurans]|uniref:Uncharacterized protein n=1 Tax=Dyella psychrodurans TaxID=1927960 RepID=A0A370X0H5_9GAMM|nr:hypothetical protein DWU99_15960 [Dyella psychrodurans]
MSRGIRFKKLWFDEDLTELEITTSDGESTFRSRVYTSHENLNEIINGLVAFKGHLHGGIYDIRLGAIGPEFARGAFHARLHFHKLGRGRLFITVMAESEWLDFTVTKVANRCTLHLISEPSLLDNFIDELKRLQHGATDEAFLALASP